MADGLVQVPPDSTGKKVDTTELTVGANTVERQRVHLAGSAAAALVDPLNSAPAGTEYALPVRNIPSGTQDENLAKIGGSAIAIKALPSGAQGQAALPVYNNAIRLPTYTLAADVTTGALTANTRKDVVSLEHSASASKTLRVRRILIGGFQTTTLVGTVYAKLYRGTAASSAGSAVTPQPTNPAFSAAEASPLLKVLTLPTITAATEVGTWAVGALGAATAQTGFPSIVVYDWQESGETEAFTLRAATLDSLVLAIFSNVAHNLQLQITIVVTEE